VIANPEWTTCKYLHRKDLPRFHVDEAIKEHASDFAGFTAMADMRSMIPVQPIRYSEKWAWKNRMFNPILNAMAQYHKMTFSLFGDEYENEGSGGLKWRFISSFAGTCDGLRSIAHVSLVRRYIDTCGSWESSYRHVLSLLQDIDITPVFPETWLFISGNGSTNIPDVMEEALWEVVFSRFSAIQEYGWHSGLKPLTRLTDSLNGSLSDFDWTSLSTELSTKKIEWTEMIIDHATKNGGFFPKDRISS